MKKYIFREVCMQEPPDKNRQPSQSAIRSARLIKHPHQFLSTEKVQRYFSRERGTSDRDISRMPTANLPMPPSPPETLPDDLSQFDPDATLPPDLFDVGSMNTVRLMQITGKMRAVRPLQQAIHPPQQNYEVAGTGVAGAWQPQSIPQTEAPPWNGVYGPQPSFGTAQQQMAAPLVSPVQPKTKARPAWKRILDIPAVKVSLGLLVGIGLLFLISRFIDFSSTIAIVRHRLTTPQGIVYALSAAAAFIAAFSIRGVRWSFFLHRIGTVSPFKAVQIFWVAVFMNFLLPVQGGELVKSLLLKRTTGIPISQSLPTVAMDRSLDLMPALIIMAVVPFLPGMHMNLALWLILGLVSSILLSVIFVVVLMAWNRAAATSFIQTMLKLLPRGIGAKIEGFALGFVDSLLAGASSPKTFIPAVLLTSLAVMCDGLFAWMAFLTVGLSQISFGTAIFGYTTYNMFSILPTPPGQLGSNETVGTIVFTNLLGFDKTRVLAMFVFSHPLAALIMTCMCLISLASLGLSFTSIMKVRSLNDEKKAISQRLPQVQQPQQMLQAQPSAPTALPTTPPSGYQSLPATTYNGMPGVQAGTQSKL
jgi:uncharacterized protein (TIRG00374 family)